VHDSFHLFVYGELPGPTAAEQALTGCVAIGTGTVPGLLYDIDGEFIALLPYGTSRIQGTVWRCPAEKLPLLDSNEAVRNGVFRRIGASVCMDDDQEELGCWLYVAGPALSRRLVPSARKR